MVDTMSSCSYLQNLLTMSVSFSSSSHSSTAPESEATRIPLSPTHVRSATPASVWTPAEQKPSLGAARGSLKSQREPAQQRPLRLEAPRSSAPSRGGTSCQRARRGPAGLHGDHTEQHVGRVRIWARERGAVLGTARRRKVFSPLRLFSREKQNLQTKARKCGAGSTFSSRETCERPSCSHP